MPAAIWATADTWALVVLWTPAAIWVTGDMDAGCPMNAGGHMGDGRHGRWLFYERRRPYDKRATWATATTVAVMKATTW